MLYRLLFIGLLNALVLSPVIGNAQSYYWVAFTDKNHSAYSIAHPEEFLSQRAIQRRFNQNIAVDSMDLPVNSAYIYQVLELGAEFVHSSKWLNGITVKCNIDSFEYKVLQFPFVKNIQLTKPDLTTKSAVDKFAVPSFSEDTFAIDTSYYGLSVYQVGQLNGQYLHNRNFRGQGIQIAVLDGGFYHVDVYPAFDSLRAENRLLGTKDFADPSSDFYETHYHGMSALSCMAADIPGELIGTAPEASYWLIRSEEISTEYLIEEDNWVAAAEFADSVGADVINSSLGYYTFDDASMNHTYAEMDGNTTRVTQGADIAASRGMLVFCSAGNEGNSSWKYIIAPADGENVIAVGAVDYLAKPASFTSFGPASDGHVKPNVAALGRNTYLQKSDGSLGYSSGTSFSSPVLAGMGACLWQANPAATAFQIKSAIEQSASLYPASDSLLGYGIPDMKAADQILKISSSPYVNAEKLWEVYPNPAEDYIILQNKKIKATGNIEISFFTPDGRLLRKEQHVASPQIIVHNMQGLPTGLLILSIESGSVSETFKISKIR